MCGIAGFLSTARFDEPLGAIAARMADTLVHRGPDDSGQWTDAAAGVALGHRRLSIVDLSAHGHQPMHSPSGRFTVVYNGEIYNHDLLREQLRSLGHNFRGHSDTEVLLAAIEQWGLAAAVQRFIGMFAFAVWDRVHRQLSLVRDRLGIKPLYYGWQGDTFLFGSELKALRAHPHFSGEIDRGVVALFLRYNYVPGPYSIYRGIQKLPPGSILTVSPSGRSRDAGPQTFWSVREVAEQGQLNRFTGTADEAVEQLDRLLRDAVRCRMIADVPLGAFLSGGVDSSTVVALMQDQNARAVKTFSIGFDEDQYNEAHYAGAVAKHLGTDHTEWYVSPQDARDVIPRLPAMFDEPFADASQIPTFLVSQLARRHVTVSLSGDGGDELFAGYPRYYTTPARWRRIGWCPVWLRSAAARAARLVGRCQPLEFIRRKAMSLADQLAVRDRAELYARLITHWKSPTDVVIGATVPPTLFDDRSQSAVRDEFLEQMMLLDMRTYLPDDILVKVDRASMAVALEARVPILDHRVVEFAWTLPLEMKFHDGQSKWALRRVLDRYVPRDLIERPKVGFGVPIDSWLRGPLRDWAESLLAPARLQDEGYLRPAPIQEKWQQHLTGQVDWHYHIWDVLMFQAWLESQSG